MRVCLRTGEEDDGGACVWRGGIEGVGVFAEGLAGGVEERDGDVLGMHWSVRVDGTRVDAEYVCL